MTDFNLTYIIDDDPIFVFALKKLLRNIEGFKEIINIKNGEDAILTLSELNQNNLDFPEIIFLDLNMPMLDGWQFLDELEELPFKNKLNIYIVSSSIDYNEIEKAKNYKMVRKFISKPFDNQKLTLLLENH